MVHENSVFPSESVIEKMIPRSNENIVTITTTRTTCSETVKALSVKDRGCIFEDERSLR